MEQNHVGEKETQNACGAATKEHLVILHVGDVLLDGPVVRLRRDTKEHRREELRDAFMSFLEIVVKEEADVVVFSGNLLDGRYAGDDTLRFLLQAFEQHPSCHFVIAPGPRDPYNETSIYRSKRFPRNVHVFMEEVLGTYNFPELPVTVYGWGYRADTCTHAPLAGVHKTASDRFSLLCGYTRLDRDTDENTPVDEAAIAAFGAHYTALSGGIHDGFHHTEEGIYAYSGSFEGRDSDKVAEQCGGYVRVQATRKADGWAIEAERRPLDTYSYVTERLDVSHLLTASQVQKHLEERIRERGYGAKTVLRLILFGSVSLSASFEDLDTECHGLYSVWVEDRTVPTDDSAHLLREMTARGELYRYFYPQMTEGDEEDRARAARAFRIGYAALVGEDFVKY